MPQDSDSSNPNFDDEIYSFRSRKTHRLQRVSSNLNRIERRTALSLRPISRKSYADDVHSPLTFNSDEGPKNYPKGKRTVKFKNTSWLANDQMHKMGYPNLNQYSEEDSRDAIEHNGTGEETRRKTRQTSSLNDINSTSIKNSKYLYEYDEQSRPKRSQNDVTSHSQQNCRELRSRSSNEKEKEDNLTTTRSRIQLLSDQEASKEALEDNSKYTEDVKDVKNINNNKKHKNVKNKSSSDSDVPLKLPKAERPSKVDNVVQQPQQYSLSSTRNRRGIISSDTSEDEKQQRRCRNKPEPIVNSKYSFRARPPKPSTQPNHNDFAIPAKSRGSRNLLRKRHYRRARRSSTSSSDSDSDETVRTFSKTPKSPHTKSEQRMKGKNLAGGSNIIPIGPETLDGSVRFDSVGGLDSHIQSLKEMIILPMLYPEVFGQFHINPPRGVLFHGPPGTGKTLIARALANECSLEKRKVSFFMRKGADLLSKWIGESEKQLRLLFEQAAEMKPSIIFFDELDGLIPTRSSRNDQIHASIVSTLLALMDGLDDRGEIIIIGATNRIDAIDPAFRRPGRFDRELYFPLPTKKDREEILNIHLSRWSKPPNSQLVSYLAQHAVGYCGSDLRALCTEAVIESFRRTYPQVYHSKHKLLLEPEKVDVRTMDFLRAKSMLVPAAHRINQSISKKLLPILEPLLGEHMKNIFAQMENSFPHGVNPKLARIKVSANIAPSHILLVGEGNEHGQTSYLGPAIMYKMEHIHSYVLDLSTLFRESNRSPEEATLQIINEAKKNVPSVIYIPCIDELWKLVPETTRAILIAELMQLDPHLPMLLLATSSSSYKELPERIRNMFSTYRKEMFSISPPSADQRRAFFKPLVMDNSLKSYKVVKHKPTTPPPLPKAPTPPPVPPTEEEIRKLYDKEEHTLRELRIFLRDMCRKLANNRLFYIFTKPVDLEEVPDYTTIIKQPMDLETMMTKVDLYRYECAKDFLADIELIVENALEYNPDRSSVDKQIRHKACSLRDYAYTLIKTEMDSDFEDKCQSIAESRKKRKIKIRNLPEYLVTPEIIKRIELNEKSLDAKKSDDDSKVTPARKRRVRPWSKGLIRANKRKKKDKQVPEHDYNEDKDVDKSSGDESKENKPDLDTTRMSTCTDEDTVRPVMNGSCDMSKTDHENIEMTPSRSENISWQSPRRRPSDFYNQSELLDDNILLDDADQILSEGGDNIPKFHIECSHHELELVLDQIVKHTAGYTLHSLLDLHNQLSKIVRKYLRTQIRTTLPKELQKELNRFKKEENADILSDSSQSSITSNFR
ncbi:hypothetical protein WA026_011742 [Henosepilachna vigintioctopunctata]